MLKTTFFLLVSIVTISTLQAAEIKNETGQAIQITIAISTATPAQGRDRIVTKKIEAGKITSIDDLLYSPNGFSEIITINNVRIKAGPLYPASIMYPINYVLRLSNDKKTIQLLDNGSLVAEADIKK
jgi:hypothetical protein